MVGKLVKTCPLDVKMAQNCKIMRPNPATKFEGSSLLMQDIRNACLVLSVFFNDAKLRYSRKSCGACYARFSNVENCRLLGIILSFSHTF